MPSLVTACQGPCPEDAKSLSSHPTAFAWRSNFLTAAPVEISGLGAPFFTAMAVRRVAMGVALLGMIVSDAIAPGKGYWMIETSRAWPCATILLVPTPLP